ncbi:MAG: hypothetical protein IIC04_06125 [Proteobacteria bacterium]|nr:hypothetical protein [Pseudomonadota bacterium]
MDGMNDCRHHWVIDTADGLGFVRARPAREVFDELDELDRGMDDLTRCAFPSKAA